MKKMFFTGIVILSILIFTITGYASEQSIQMTKNISNLVLNSTTNQAIQPLNIPNVNFTLPGNGLKGDYYRDRNLNYYSFSRIDNLINFNWGKDKSPGAGIGHNDFSVRWTGYVVPKYDGTYTFYTNSDDGVKLYINGRLIINDWSEHSAREKKFSLELVAGQPYPIELMYFQRGGDANIKLLWSSYNQQKEVVPQSQLYSPPIQAPFPSGNGTGLKGSYYDGSNFNKLKETKIDKTINLLWNYKAGQKHNPFSIRWTGKIQPLYSDLYTFRTIADDGIRVWVNNQIIIDDWRDNNSKEDRGSIFLQAGQLYDIKVEFYENDKWPAVIKLYWSSANQPLEIIPQKQLYEPVNPAGTGRGLKGDYYTDVNLAGLKNTRIDNSINFDWGENGIPADGVSHNNFSVRWTGKLQPLYSETYTIKTMSDDGVRLWINNIRFIDDWNTHGVKENSFKVFLEAGQMYDIRLEYFQSVGPSKIQLLWSSPSQKYEIIPQTQLYSN